MVQVQRRQRNRPLELFFYLNVWLIGILSNKTGVIMPNSEVDWLRVNQLKKSKHINQCHVSVLIPK